MSVHRARPLLFLGRCARHSPLGFESRVGCADGGAVAAFEGEGGGDGRLDDVGAGCFCDLFGSQVVLGERPQGDGSRFLIDDHGVGLVCDWGDSGFRPDADDASAVPFPVVVVVAVDEVVGVHVEAVSEQVPAVGERGCCPDGNVGSVGEGDGAGGDVEVSRVNNLLTREQIVQSAGVVLGGVGVDGVDHGVFSCVGCVFLSGSIVACCGVACMVFRCFVVRVLGAVLVMLAARACESGCTLLGKRNGASAGETGGGAQTHKRSAPLPLVFARVFGCALGRLLMRQPDCGVGGGGFAVDGASVAVFDGEAVVCGSSTVNARVEGDGCGAAGCGGVEGDNGCFASVSPGGAGGGHVVVVVACDGGVFCHGLCLVCVGGLFACVLCACACDPRVGDGADGVAVREVDGGGVAASFVVAWLVVEGGVYGDGVCVSRVGGACLARVLVVDVAVTLAVVAVVVVAWGEGEYAVVCVNNGLAD